MPLSEREQKLLEQLEQQLAEDTQFASQMQGKAPSRINRKRAVAGVLGVLVGLGVVVLGVSTQMIWVGAIGFLIMVFGGYLAATPHHGDKPHLHSVGGTHPARGHGRSTGAKRPGTGSPFMDRLARRWEQRRRDGLL